MGISEQFGLYDVAAHVIPGAMVLAAAALVAAAGGAPLPWDADGAVVAVLGFALAYVVGTLCQEAGGRKPVRLLVKGPSWSCESQESSRLLQDLRAPQGSPLLWVQVREAIARHLLLDVPTTPSSEPTWPEAWRRLSDPPVDVRRREQAFRACYATVLQDGNPARAQMFKAISAFHESMAVASLLVLPLGGAAALVGRAVPWAVGGALLAAAGLGGFLVFRKAYETFDRRFVDEVYSAFLALARRFEREGSAGGP